MSTPGDCLRCGVCCFSQLETYVRVSGDDWTRLGDDGQRVAHFIGHRAYMKMSGGHCAGRNEFIAGRQNSDARAAADGYGRVAHRGGERDLAHGEGLPGGDDRDHAQAVQTDTVERALLDLPGDDGVLAGEVELGIREAGTGPDIAGGQPLTLRAGAFASTGRQINYPPQ